MSEKDTRYKDIIFALETLVKIVTVTTPNSKISITLNVGGTIITGDLVSVNQFHYSLKHTMLDNLKEKDNRETFRGLHAVLEKLEEVPAMDEQNNFNFDYLCVENAKIYQQSGYYTAQVPYWIGKMQSVDGFSLGEIEIPSQP